MSEPKEHSLILHMDNGQQHIVPYARMANLKEAMKAKLTWAYVENRSEGTFDAVNISKVTRITTVKHDLGPCPVPVRCTGCTRDLDDCRCSHTT